MSAASALAWSAVAPGVWAARIGDPEAFTPLSALQARPAVAGLAALPGAPPPFAPGEMEAARVGGRLVIRLPLRGAESVFGLGLQFFRLDHRGRTRHLRVNSDPRQDTGETHAPVPFYVGGAGYGVLFDTARIVTVHVASAVRREEAVPVHDRTSDPGWKATPPAGWVEAVLDAPGVRVLAFAGPTPLDAVRRYNLFCGGGCLPPRWGLGFWHRTPTRFRDEEVRAEAAEYRRRGLPCDVIGLEPGWHTSAYPCTFEWAPERFPDPAGFVAALARDGFRVNLWEHAWVSPRARIHAALQPLSGSHTVWGGLAPDLTLPEARAVLEEQHARVHVDAGISGYKLDECDGSELTGSSWMFPAHATFPSGRDGEQMRQVYGLLLQRMMDGVFRDRGRRTFGLVRASGSGAAPLPFVLYTDLYDHRQYVRALANAGFSGLLFGAEVRSARSPEEWVRRVQVACLSPLAMLNAWSSGTKPWSFPEVEGAVRAALELRMRLVPYLYSAFARYREDGTPPFRPMALEPGAGEAARVDDQYMLGDDLLVAPVIAGDAERTVRLPQGDWYGFADGRRWTGGGEPFTVAPPLDEVPIFVRAGAVVPLGPVLPHTPRAGERIPLEVRHYGPRPGGFLLYDDDGETLACEHGVRRWLRLAVDVQADGTRSGRIEGGDPAAAGPGLAYDPITWRWMGED